VTNWELLEVPLTFYDLRKLKRDNKDMQMKAPWCEKGGGFQEGQARRPP